MILGKLGPGHFSLPNWGEDLEEGGEGREGKIERVNEGEEENREYISSFHK